MWQECGHCGVTLELSQRNAIMHEYLAIGGDTTRTFIADLHSCSLFASSARVKHGTAERSAVPSRWQHWEPGISGNTIPMTSFAINDSDWPGQHSVMGT